MSNGPVSEGSIVAYIGADDDDYQEKMRRAQATAEELGRSDPTVNVHADVATALAKIDEVASKTNELTRLRHAGCCRPCGSERRVVAVPCRVAARGDPGEGHRVRVPAGCRERGCRSRVTERGGRGAAADRRGDRSPQRAGCSSW